MVASNKSDQIWPLPLLLFLSLSLLLQALVEEDTPFGRIARPFFNGNDDEFRNGRFKLIPKVVDGNLMIKMAVKDTPTLIGNKLKQYYSKVRTLLHHFSPLEPLVQLCNTEPF